MPVITIPGHPTDKQREAWEAVERLGTQLAASRELGIHQGSLQTRMRGYQRAMGITGDLPGLIESAGIAALKRKPKGEGQVSRLRHELRVALARIEQLEADNERQAARIADLEALARPWVDVHRKLDALLARPSGPAVVTHRRIADGGVGGKRERQGKAA